MSLGVFWGVFCFRQVLILIFKAHFLLNFVFIIISVFTGYIYFNKLELYTFHLLHGKIFLCFAEDIKDEDYELLKKFDLNWMFGPCCGKYNFEKNKQYYLWFHFVAYSLS